MAKAKRKTPSPDTLRELFLKSGNQCAFPGCRELMMNRDGVFIGQICHIEAALEGGERFNPAMTDDERAAFPNLTLMCYPHHQVTNDVQEYPVARLQGIKAEHEAKFTDIAKAMEEGFDRQVAGDGGIDQRGVGHRAVIAPNNSGVIDQSQHHHYHHPTNGPNQIEIKPTREEIEILKRLGEDPDTPLTLYQRGGVYMMAVGATVLSPPNDLQGAVRLYEAFQRLCGLGLLTDMNQGGCLYYLTTKGEDAAQQVITQLEDTAAQDLSGLDRQMPKLFAEIRKDLGTHPLMREAVLLKRDWCYNMNKPVLKYYYDDHPDLDAMFDVLANNDLVADITRNSTKRFRLGETLVRFLLRTTKLDSQTSDFD